MENPQFSMGEIIRSIRRSRSCTQDALAQAVGISVQAVSKWETGASLPDITLLPAIADFLGISIDTLFNREPSASEAEQPAVSEFPFPDDGRLRIVQYKGSRLVSSQEAAQGDPMRLLIEASDSELTVEIQGSARISGDIRGNVQTQGDLYLSGSIHGDVQSEGSVHDEHTDAAAKSIVSFESIFSSVFDSMGSLFSGKNSKSSRMNAFFSGSLPDDDVIRVIQMQGRRIMSTDEVSSLNPIRLSVEHINENVLNVEIHGSAQIQGNVGGSVKADDSVSCGSVSGSVNAGDSVSCGNVGGTVNAGDHVNCGDVGGSVNAGDSVTCGDIRGNVRADTIKYRNGNSKSQDDHIHIEIKNNTPSEDADEPVHIRINWQEQAEKIRQTAQEQAEKIRQRTQEQAQRMKEQSIKRMKEQNVNLEKTLRGCLPDMPDMSAYGHDVLNILQVMNGRILSSQDGDAQPIRLALDDACDLTVQIHGNAAISGDVHGNIHADGDVSCITVEGDVSANKNVTCESAEGDVSAANVTCVAIGGDVRAEGSVKCEGSIAGDVSSQGSVNCDGSISGDVSAVDNVSCESISGDVRAGGAVTCETIEGDVTSGGDVTCDNIEGDVRTDGCVNCGSVEGDVIAYGSFHCEGDIEGDVYRR